MGWLEGPLCTAPTSTDSSLFVHFYYNHGGSPGQKCQGRFFCPSPDLVLHVLPTYFDSFTAYCAYRVFHFSC